MELISRPSTEDDFFIWIDADWDVYLNVYHWYYSDDLEAKIEEVSKGSGQLAEDASKLIAQTLLKSI